MKDIKYKSSEYSHTPRSKESQSIMAVRVLTYHALDLVSSKMEPDMGVKVVARKQGVQILGSVKLYLDITNQMMGSGLVNDSLYLRRMLFLLLSFLFFSFKTNL